MYVIPLIAAVVLMLVALTGQRGRMIGLAFSWVPFWPAVMPLGLNSAIYVPELVLTAALFPWIISPRAPGAGRFGWYIVIMLAWVMITTLLGYMSLGTYAEIPYRVPLAGLRFSALLLAFAIPAFTLVDQQRFLSSLRAFRIGTYIFLIVGIVEYVLPGSLAYYFPSGGLGKTTEAKWVWIGGPDRCSVGLLGLTTIFCSILSIKLRQVRWPLGYATALAAIFVVLVVQSRTTVLAIGVLGLALVMMYRGQRFRNVLLVALGVFVVFLVAQSIPFVAERLGTLENLERAGSERIPGWHRAVAFLLAHPREFLMGVGAGLWALSITPYAGLHNGHNVFLHVWGELGLVGAALYFGFWLCLLVQVYRASRLQGEAATIGGATLCFLVAMAFANLTEAALYPEGPRINLTFAVMILMGIIAGRLKSLAAEDATAEIGLSTDAG